MTRASGRPCSTSPGSGESVPTEICAVGDDTNDVPMLRGAGLGVAMGHANTDVLAAADLVTGSDDEDGLAALIEGVLLA